LEWQKVPFLKKHMSAASQPFSIKNPTQKVARWMLHFACFFFMMKEEMFSE
jgi:hypothetical protein